MPSLPAASNLDTARAFLRRAQETQPELTKWAYLLHLPAADTCWVGCGAHRVVNYNGTVFEIMAGDHKTTLPAGPDFFRDLRQLLDPEQPCFFLVSLDIKRPVSDPALPLMRFVQPMFEVCFDRHSAAPSVNLMKAGSGLEKSLRELLASSAANPSGR